MICLTFCHLKQTKWPVKPSTTPLCYAVPPFQIDFMCLKYQVGYVSTQPVVAKMGHFKHPLLAVLAWQLLAPIYN